MNIQVMKEELHINLNGKGLKIPAGTRIYEILPRAPHKGKFLPLGVIVNGRLDGLYYKLKSDARVETIDLSRREGMDIYRRTASILLCAATAEVAPSASIMVGQSISDNYFFEVKGCKVNSQLISKLEKKMRTLVKEDIQLKREWTAIEEAIQIFEQEGQKDKVTLLKQSKRSEIPLVKIDGYHGIVYGPIAHKTSSIRNFKLHKYEHGILLGFPDSEGYVAATIPRQPKLFRTYVETKSWHELIGASNIAQLNEHCIEGTISELVKIAEALHENKIAEIAKEIASRKGVKLVLVAGPSGSGKTTFLKRLEIQLRILGIDPLALSLDNYYVDREDTPKHPDGTYNFECVGALDIGLLNKQLRELLSGWEVNVPRYNFPLGKQDLTKGRKVKLGKHQILMLEGIHGLNDRLSRAVKRKNKFKIYVSALTQLSLDNHNRIFTTDTRLIRRIVRDRLFRGANAAETISLWPSVRLGETKYIFPYQEDADVIFNSALAYEPALLKSYAERFLMEVDRESPAFMEATRLLRFFAYLVPIMSREVPQTSIIREFIGGSAFRY